MAKGLHYHPVNPHGSLMSWFRKSINVVNFNISKKKIIFKMYLHNWYLGLPWKLQFEILTIFWCKHFIDCMEPENRSQDWPWLFFFSLFAFWDRVLLFSPDCPGTSTVDHAGLKLTWSASQVLGVKVCVTTRFHTRFLPGHSNELILWILDSQNASSGVTKMAVQ